MPTALVIDDEPLIAQFLQDEVIPDWAVWSALNGVAALELLRRADLTQNRPDLIILDIRLPDMDGRDILLRVRKLCGAIPILPFTGIRSDEDSLPQYMRELGCAPLVRKGVPPDVLRSCILNAVDLPAMVIAPGPAILSWAHEKARGAEHAALSQRRPPRAMLFARSMYDRAAIAALVDHVQLAEFASVTAPNDLAAAAHAHQVDLILGSMADANEILSACRDSNLPLLLIASSPELAATIKTIKAANPDRLISSVSAHDNLCVQRITTAIQSLLQGVSYEDPHLLITDRSSQSASNSLQRLFSDLSPRLIEVVVLHTLGWSNSEIATSMGITEATVLKYWKRVYERLHMTRTEVRRFASSQMLAHPSLFVSWQHLERPSATKIS